MKKLSFLLMIVLLVMVQASISNAQTFEAYLNAGSSTVQAGLDLKNPLDQGYLRTGVSGLYTDRDQGEYKTLDAHVTVGNEILIKGFDGELGLKGLIGSVDRGYGNSDLGSIAFMACGSYQFPKAIVPVTTKIFTELSLTPGPLAFMDMDRYFDMKIGVDIFLVENAALEFCYQHYDMRMEDTPRDWTMRDNIFTIGIKLKF